MDRRETFDIPWFGAVDCTFARSARVRSLLVRETTRVEVPVVDGRDAPVVISAKTGGHPSAFLYRRWGGTLIAPLFATTFQDGFRTYPPPDLLRQSLAEGPSCTAYRLLGDQFAFGRGEACDHIPLGVSRIVEDRREAMRERIEAVAARLVVVDGTVYAERAEPAFVLHWHVVPTAGWGYDLNVPQPHDRELPRFAFRLDRWSAVDDLVRERFGGDFRPRHEIVELDPGALVFDDARYNAVQAATQVMTEAGKRIAAMPTAAAEGLFELAKARDAVGLHGPEPVVSACAALARAAPDDKSLRKVVEFCVAALRGPTREHADEDLVAMAP